MHEARIAIELKASQEKTNVAKINSVQADLERANKKILDLERNISDIDLKRGELILNLQDREKVLHDRLRDLKGLERQN